jgi:hypothetical protein
LAWGRNGLFMPGDQSGRSVTEAIPDRACEVHLRHMMHL